MAAGEKWPIISPVFTLTWVSLHPRYISSGIQVKKYDSEEPLLRCILEAYTNFKTVDATKLKQDFELDQQKPLRPAAIVFRDQE